MASQKAWYWLAAGVLALGINSEYQSGNLQSAHRYLHNSIGVVRDYARCAGRYLAQFEVLLTLSQPGLAPAQNRVKDAEPSRYAQNLPVGEQVQYALAQAEMARREVERHRPEIEKALRELECHHTQIEMTRQAALDTAGAAVVCPHRRIRVTVPEVRIPQVRVAVPQVAIDNEL